MEENRKKDGFDGQKAIVIPRKILGELCFNHPMTARLYLTDIGYYPKAKFHFRERPHGADQHILIYCMDGNGQLTIEGEKFDISAGDFFIIPAGTAHEYVSSVIKPWTIFWIHFKGDEGAAIISLCKKQLNGYKGSRPDGKKSIAIFDEMYQQLERGYSSDHLIYANMCLWHFLATFVYAGQPHHTNTMQRDNSGKVIDFLNQNLHRMLSLDDMAASINLSPSHFSFVFKKKTGFTPIEYFNHLKVQKACQYLLFTDLRIKEIALELGIEDQFYFSRMFTKIMGQSPNEYREKKIQ